MSNDLPTMPQLTSGGPSSGTCVLPDEAPEPSLSSQGAFEAAEDTRPQPLCHTAVRSDLPPQTTFREKPRIQSSMGNHLIFR